MELDRWERLKDILVGALEREPEGRRHFIMRACQEDPRLLSEALVLLHEHEQAGSFLSSPVVGPPISDDKDSEPQFHPDFLLAERFRIVRFIARGGMGEVYEAEDLELGERVALKTIRPELAVQSAALSLFKNEIQLARRISHSNVCRIFDLGYHMTRPDEGRPGITAFCTMELLPGQTLAEHLGRHGSLPPDQAMAFIEPIASALHAAHQAGVIHRDLKPGNVLLVGSNGSRRVVVTDFGLALPAAMAEAEAQARPGGTLAYMAPEQLNKGALTPAVDIYSLGVLIARVIGRPAPGTATARDWNRRADPRFDPVIARCCHPDPAKRYPSAMSVVADLKAALSPELNQYQHAKRRLLWLAPAAITLALMTAGWWLFQSTRESRHVLTAIPFTTYHGFEGRATFSPDGNQVAFQWNGENEDNEDIYVKSLGTEKPLRLTSDPAIDAGPSWSPDGTYIAFLRVESNRVAVMAIPPAGGIERKVYETRYVWKAELSGRKLACTPDGRGFVISERHSPSDPNALFLIMIDTGERLRLTSPPRGFEGDSDPVFSPDGRILTFSRKRAEGSDDLFRMNLNAGFRPVGEPQPLTNRMPAPFRNFVGHAWGANEREIIVSLAYAANRFDLWRIPLDDPESSTRLEFVGEGGTYPVVSGSARRMVYQKALSTVSVWTLEDSGEARKRPSPTRLLSSTQWDSHCQVSPDGNKIAFRSFRSGFSEICSSNSDGSGFAFLTSYNGPACGAPAWSPDGRWIAYDARPDGQSEIYVVSVEGGAARRITDHPGEDIMPSWSRNGRWIYFTSNRTGLWQVWKMAVGGGNAVQATHRGGFYGLESHDGKTLYYGKRLFELGVYRMPVEGGEEELFLPGAWATRFAPTANGYYFWTSDRALTFLDSSTAARRVVAVLDKPPGDFLSVFPDGKRIVYSQVDQSASDLYLVNNFR